MAEGGEAGLPHNHQDSHTRQSGNNNGKSAESGGPHQTPKQPQPDNTTSITCSQDPRSNSQALKCPECGCERLYRDGLRYLADGRSVQRWLCTLCRYRFSQPKVEVDVAGKVHEGVDHILDSGDIHASGFLPREKCSDNNALPLSEDVGPHACSPFIHTVRKVLNTSYPYNKDCRVSDERNGPRKDHDSPVEMKHTGSGRATVLLTGGTKNLAEVETRQEKPMREGTATQTAENKGLVAQYAFLLEKEGYYEHSSYLKLIKRLATVGAFLHDPEHVKQTIAEQKWKNSVKTLAAYAYNIMVRNILKTE